MLLLGWSPNEHVWTGLQWSPPDVSSGVPSVMFRGVTVGGIQIWCWGEGTCIVRSNPSWVMVTWNPPWTVRHTHACENITFPQFRWHAVINVHVLFYSLPKHIIHYILNFIFFKRGILFFVAILIYVLCKVWNWDLMWPYCDGNAHDIRMGEFPVGELSSKYDFDFVLQHKRNS